MSQAALYHAALALAAGVAAQTLAFRLRVPSIVLLLGAGLLLGPDGLGVLDPGVLGAGLPALLGLAVAVILFEGALALDVQRLRQQRQSLVRLLTLGALVSMIVGTLAARLLLGFSWPIAALYGAIVIVTGPTVVTPLLSRLDVDRPLRELLVSEGVIIDPIGAIVAIVTLEYVVGSHAALESGWLVLVRLGTGGIVGTAAGLALTLALRRRWIPEELRNPAVFGAILLVGAGTSRMSAEAGLMAVVVQGIVVGNGGVRDLGRLREFKETLTVVLLSFVFVVLAAGVPLTEVRALGWRALAVVALLAWVARPLAVLVSTAGSELTLRQRLFVAWICPRGIVAAAVAGLFGFLLDDAGIPGGRQLEGLVFVTVASTVTVQGLTARAAARLLGVDAPAQRGTIIVGADHLGRFLELLLAGLGQQAVVVDRSAVLCRIARAEGLSVYEGDALSVEALEEAGGRYADTVVALTRNAELNALVAQRVRDNFRVGRVLVLGADDAEKRPFPGDFPGVDEANRLLRLGRLCVVGYTAAEGGPAGQRLGELPYGPGEFALALQHGEGAQVAGADLRLGTGDRLWCAVPPEISSQLAELLTPTPAAARPSAPERP